MEVSMPKTFCIDTLLLSNMSMSKLSVDPEMSFISASDSVSKDQALHLWFTVLISCSFSSQIRNSLLWLKEKSTSLAIVPYCDSLSPDPAALQCPYLTLTVLLGTTSFILFSFLLYFFLNHFLSFPFFFSAPPFPFFSWLSHNTHRCVCDLGVLICYKEGENAEPGRHQQRKARRGGCAKMG